MPLVYGAPGDACFEKLDGDFCGIASGDFTQAILGFYNVFFPGFATIIVWAPVVGIIWQKSKRPELAGIIGMVISASFMPVEYSINEDALGIGILLFVLSVAISAFQMTKEKLMY